MSKILLVVAHPALEKSRNNIRLMKTAENIDHVSVRDLYELYPRFSINVQKEQEYLEQHDIIILQHPFYWYSIPALMKQYLDMVFTHGWAYGKGICKLKDKVIFNALTTSGTRESYNWDAHNRFPLTSFLVPYNQLAFVCKMHYLPPFVLHESGKADASLSSNHARQFKQLLEMFSKSKFDLDRLRELDYLNDYSFENIKTT
jgi:glutathione-regulated potassium-efflux system ancillary protein KefG